MQVTGTSTVGCWALIQGMLLIARVADSGAAANVTRHVAHTLRVEGAMDFGAVLRAVLIVSFAPVAALGIAVAPPIYLYVSRRFGSEVDPTTIRALVIDALIFAVLSSLASLALAALEGYQWLVARNVVTMVANAAALALAWPILVVRGGAGLGDCYVIQATVQVLLAAAVLMRAVRGHPTPRRRRAVDVARDLWRENLQLSTVALIQLCLEPAVKVGLGLTTDLVNIARFELALRISTQVRVLFQSALQPLLAFGARKGGFVPYDAAPLFESVGRIVARVVVAGAVVEIVSGPALSYLGLGEVSGQFLLDLSLLTLANTLNILGLVGYFTILSGGELGALRRILLEMALLSIVGGVLGVLWQASQVIVLGYCVAIAWGGWRCLTYAEEWVMTSWRQAGALLSLALMLVALYRPLSSSLGEVAAVLLSASEATCLLAVLGPGVMRALRLPGVTDSPGAD